jgi:hypothetical protein
MYVESFARVRSLSLSGKLLYHFVDRWDRRFIYKEVGFLALIRFLGSWFSGQTLCNLAVAKITVDVLYDFCVQLSNYGHSAFKYEQSQKHVPFINVHVYHSIILTIYRLLVDSESKPDFV